MYTLRPVGGGDEVELDLFDGSRCMGDGLGCSSMLPVCLRCSTTDTNLAKNKVPNRNAFLYLPSFFTFSVIAAMSSGDTRSSSEGSARSGAGTIFSLTGGEVRWQAFKGVLRRREGLSRGSAVYWIEYSGTLESLESK